MILSFNLAYDKLKNQNKHAQFLSNRVQKLRTETQQTHQPLKKMKLKNKHPPRSPKLKTYLPPNKGS